MYPTTKKNVSYPNSALNAWQHGIHIATSNLCQYVNIGYMVTVVQHKVDIESTKTLIKLTLKLLMCML